MPVHDPLVSVVVPVYNADAYLSACISSILEQTYTHFELLIVDDGSTDDLADMIAAVAAKDYRIRVIRQVHSGVTRAFINGFNHSTGTLVARMDADDVMLPQRLELQVNFLQQHPQFGAVSGMVQYGGSREHQQGYAMHIDWLNSLRDEDEIFQARFIDSPVANPSIMFRRELWQVHGGPKEGDFPEDYEQWLRWMEQGVRFAKVHEPVIIWNDPPTRLTRNDSRYSPDAFARVKVPYLIKHVLRNYNNRKIAVCGAGRVTRKRYREFLNEIMPMISCFVDVAPQRVGGTIETKPVVTLENITNPEEYYVVVLTAMHGAREGIRSNLTGKSFSSRGDFVEA
jgi:glycosyltransferase involved in cell wall biosynthesis